MEFINVPHHVVGRKGMPGLFDQGFEGYVFKHHFPVVGGDVILPLKASRAIAGSLYAEKPDTVAIDYLNPGALMLRSFRSDER
jgi:hypothetical protein